MFFQFGKVLIVISSNSLHNHISRHPFWVQKIKWLAGKANADEMRAKKAFGGTAERA